MKPRIVFHPLTWVWEKVAGWTESDSNRNIIPHIITSHAEMTAEEMKEVQKVVRMEKSDLGSTEALAQNLIENVRRWRIMLKMLSAAKESARIVEEERELRKEMGQALGSEPATLRIDGKALAYKPKTITGSEDFEAAWKSLLPTLSEGDRRRAHALLQRKSARIAHEFVTE